MGSLGKHWENRKHCPLGSGTKEVLRVLLLRGGTGSLWGGELPSCLEDVRGQREAGGAV